MTVITNTILVVLLFGASIELALGDDYLGGNKTRNFEEESQLVFSHVVSELKL